MKKVVITQNGVRGISFERAFILEMPDHVELDDLDNCDLAELADHAGVKWVLVGVEDREIYVEEDFDPADHARECSPHDEADLPIVKWER